MGKKKDKKKGQPIGYPLSWPIQLPRNPCARGGARGCRCG